MATSHDGTWLPGIGDPTAGGWITVAAYFAAAWLCWRLVSKPQPERMPIHRPLPTSEQRFWWLLFGAMVFLGINKQLDLQTAFTEMGRAVARSGGWYEQRHQVQQVFIVAVAAVGMAVLGVLGWVSWPLTRARALALGGLVFLAGFIVIRAASFHHVDLLIHSSMLGLRWNWIVELSGIGLVAAGAWRAWRDSLPGPRHSPRAARAAPLRAAFTPYKGSGGRAAAHAPKATPHVAPHVAPEASPSPSSATATPSPGTAAPRRAAPREFADDRPVRSPGDPRNRG